MSSLLTDDPDYSPEYQDAYQRLWHLAAADRDRYKTALREIAEADAKTPVLTLNRIAERALENSGSKEPLCHCDDGGCECEPEKWLREGKA